MTSRFVPPFYDVGSGIKPPSGAQLFFYITGTNTPKDTYTTSVGAAGPSNDNPVTANSVGVFPDIYITGDYWVTLKDKNNEQIYGGVPINEFAKSVSAGTVKNFPTLDVAALDTDLVENDTANLKEHTSGKGGGALWDVVLTSSGTAGAGFVASAVAGLSLKLRIVEHMNVKQWGMFGGVNEDSIWQDVIASGAVNIFLNRGVSYEINSLFAVDGQVIKGNGCTMLVTGTNQVFTIASGEMRDITFDGNDDEHGTAASEILPGSGVVIDNVKYQEFHGKTSFQTYCIQWGMWGVFDFTINRCKFKNITQNDNGAVVGRGFVGAILMTSTVLGTNEDTSYGTVSRIRGDHIYSVDDGSPAVQDSDMIRFFWDTGNGAISNMNWDITFTKITAINVGKRVFKTGGISGCSIKTVRCYKTDGLFDPMYSVISLSGDSNRWDVTDIKGSGDFQRGIETSGVDHNLSHVQLTTTTTSHYGIVFGTVAFSCSRNIADNFNLKGFASSIYFFDSFDSKIDNYLSDSALGVINNNTSGGNVNTISNGVHKDGISITNGAFLFINDCRIEDYPVSSAYAFDLQEGSCKVRGLTITSDSARRMMNLAIRSGSIVDIDDVSLIRNIAGSPIANDHNIFSTLDAIVGSRLIIGTLKVTSNANPAGAAGAMDGNAHVLLKNVEYTADLIEVRNNATRGTYGSDIRTSSPQGACAIGRLVTQQPIAGGSVLMTNSTDNTYIGTAEIENAFNNTFSVYLGTAVLRGSLLAGVLNTPTTITIP